MYFKAKEWEKNDMARDKGLVEPEDIVKYFNISYGPYGESNLLDIYRPDETSVLPVVVSVHGGAYFYGDKDLYRFYCMQFAKEGFAVVNFNYRLSPESKFPAPLEDINEMLTWLKNNAKEYNLDTDKIILIGDSAGAQLASQYATIFTNQEYRNLFKLKTPDIKIIGLSLACGLYDLKGEDDFVKFYLGNKINDDKRLSIVEYITEEYPPVCIFSSDGDFLYDAFEEMVDVLKSKGIPTTAEVFKGPHVFHIDIRSEEAKAANTMQFEFIKSVGNDNKTPMKASE